MLTNDMGKHLMLWFTMTMRGVSKRGLLSYSKFHFTSLLPKQVPMYEIQRGNCASILGTVESPKWLEELFDLFDTKSDHYHN